MQQYNYLHRGPGDRIVVVLIGTTHKHHLAIGSHIEVGIGVSKKIKTKAYGKCSPDNCHLHSLICAIIPKYSVSVGSAWVYGITDTRVSMRIAFILWVRLFIMNKVLKDSDFDLQKQGLFCFPGVVLIFDLRLL